MVNQNNNIETMNEDYYLDTAPTHFGLANTVKHLNIREHFIKINLTV